MINIIYQSQSLKILKNNEFLITADFINADKTTSKLIYKFHKKLIVQLLLTIYCTNLV